MHALAILFGAGFTILSSIACGRLLLRDRAADSGMAFVTGAAILNLVVFALCAVGMAYPVVFLVTGATALVLARPQSWFRGRKARLRGAMDYALFALFLVFFAIYFVHAMAPEGSPDGAGYHLGLVSRYLREHGFHRITTSIYADLSQGIEMLFLFAFAFGNHSAAALVHLAFLVALVWQMFSYSRAAGFPRAGACGAFLVFASPVVGIDASSAYNDVAVAAIAFTLFYLLELWDARHDARLLVAIGLVAGFSYAAKYTAALAVPYAVGFVLWKSRRWRSAAVVACFAALLIVPWMAKNWLWVHNPVAPFFNNWFPNPYITNSFEKDYSAYLRHYELSSPAQIPMQVTTDGRLAGVLGPVFLLAPIAILALLRSEGRRLLLAALVFGATYFTNIGARFLIPPLPFIALAMALAASRAGIPALLALIVAHAVLSWPANVPKYAHENPWRLRGFPWREALRLRGEEAWLERLAPDYPVARLVESSTPPGATVFAFTGVPQAYVSRRLVVEYESAEGQMLGRMLRTAALPEDAPTLRLRFPFARRPLRAIRVVQTNSGTDVWTIHELRIFDGARELARQPRWRLRANSYPWGIQDAFDNSILTFWMCGDPLHPGMFVEVNFGGTEWADLAQIETAPNQWQVQLKLEGQTASGTWAWLAQSPRVSEEAPPVGLRRAVVAELKRHGIDYLLLFDKDAGAEELHHTRDAWGVREVGHYKTARLYQLP